MRHALALVLLLLPAAAFPQRRNLLAPSPPILLGPTGGKFELGVAAGYSALSASSLDLSGFAGAAEFRVPLGASFAAVLGAGGSSLGGRLHDGSAYRGGTLLTGDLEGRLEWRRRAAAALEYGVFLGAAAPFAWLDLPGNFFAVAPAPTPPSSVWTLYLGLPAGVRAAASLGGFVLAAQSAYTRWVGGAAFLDFAAPNPIKPPRAEKVDGFNAFEAGAGLRHDETGLGLSGAWLRAWGGGQPPYEGLVLRLEWRKRWER